MCGSFVVRDGECNDHYASSTVLKTGSMTTGRGVSILHSYCKYVELYPVRFCETTDFNPADKQHGN